MVDRIMDAIEPSEWGAAAEVQLCYEIKARARAVLSLHPLTAASLQTFVLAGHETSAAMLTWSLFELSRTPVRRLPLSSDEETLSDADASARRAGFRGARLL